MGVKKEKIGVTHDIAMCKDCLWTSEEDVYSHDADKAAKDHVRFNKGHKVIRETATATHYTNEETP